MTYTEKLDDFLPDPIKEDKIFMITGPDKRPVDHNNDFKTGLKWSKADNLLTFDEAVETHTQAPQGCMIAVALGDGLCCIDFDGTGVDGESDGFWSLNQRAFFNKIRHFSITERSMSGSGLHCFFLSDQANFEVKKALVHNERDKCFVEGWSEGRYIILTGEQHCDHGIMFGQDEQSPADIVNDVFKKPDFSLVADKANDYQPTYRPNNISSGIGLSDQERAERYIESCRENTSFAEGGRNIALFKLAGNLRKCVKDDSLRLTMVLNANQRLCSPPLPEGEVIKTFESAMEGKDIPYEACDKTKGAVSKFASGFELAITPPALLEDEDLEIYREVGKLANDARPYESAIDYSKIYTEKGLIGEVARRAADCQPNFLLPAADLVAALGSTIVLANGRVRCGRNMGGSHAALYMSYITPSGNGKDTPKQQIGGVANCAGLGNQTSRTEISSGQGFMKTFAEESGEPYQVILNDEMADQWSGRNGKVDPVTASIGRAMKKMYDCGPHPFTPTGRVDADTDYTIRDPSCSIIGFMQPKVWDLIPEEQLYDGLGGRFLWFGDSVRGKGDKVLKPYNQDAPAYRRADKVGGRERGAADERLMQLIKAALAMPLGDQGTSLNFSTEANRFFNAKKREHLLGIANATDEPTAAEVMKNRIWDKVTRLSVLICFSELLGKFVDDELGEEGDFIGHWGLYEVELRHVELAYEIACDSANFAAHSIAGAATNDYVKLADALLSAARTKCEWWVSNKPDCKPYEFKFSLARVKAWKSADPNVQAGAIAHIKNTATAHVFTTNTGSHTIVPAEFIEYFNTLS